MKELTFEQVQAFRKGKDIATTVLPAIEWLEKVALGVPDIRERVDELRARRDYLEQMCAACLAAVGETDEQV